MVYFFFKNVVNINKILFFGQLIILCGASKRLLVLDVNMANYSGRSLFRQLFLLFCCYVFNLEASKNDEFFEELYIKPLQSGHVSFYFQFTTKWNISLQDADNCEPHSLDVDHVTNKSRRLICSFLFPRRNYPKQHTADGRLYALFFLLRVNILRLFFQPKTVTQ